MALLATVRPDDWNLALFFHVLGAMIVVGGLVLGLVYLAAAWRGDSAESLRAGFKALLYVALPGYIVMRGGAEGIYSKEHLDEATSDPSWIGIGFGVADAGLLFLLIATITAGVASRRAQAGGEGAASPPVIGVRVAASLCAVMVLAYVVAIWAMTAKPA